MHFAASVQLDLTYQDGNLDAVGMDVEFVMGLKQVEDVGLMDVEGKDAVA